MRLRFVCLLALTYLKQFANSIVLAFAGTLLSSNAFGAVVSGPFVEETGNWTVINNGGFENGTTGGWSDVNGSRGSWTASEALVFNGSFSAVAESSVDFVDFGFALAQPVGLTPGELYVLSGFFNTSQAVAGEAYLDLSDITNDPEPGSNRAGAPLAFGLDEWQFASLSFTAPSSSVTVRIVRDAIVTTSELVYADEIAITLASDFEAPVTIPEPSSIASLLLSIALLTSRRRVF